MGLGYKRRELQRHADAKLHDAQILLRAGRHSNAYYLGGYAVEIGLKACIAAQFTADTIPDKSFVNSIYIHDLKKLVSVAGLGTELQKHEDNDVEFAANWAIVAQWTETARYESVDPITATSFIAAISNQQSGVLQWIKQFW